MFGQKPMGVVMKRNYKSSYVLLTALAFGVVCVPAYPSVYVEKPASEADYDFVRIIDGQKKYYKLALRQDDTRESQARQAGLSGNIGSAGNPVLFKGLTENGAIENNNTSNVNVYADFVENSDDMGGAINNSGKIGTIKGDFATNSATTGGGAILNSNTGIIDTINGKFKENDAGQGGAINNRGTINKIDAKFVKNSAKGDNTNLGQGGAIYNGNHGQINIISADKDINFVENTADQGGAVYNSGAIYDGETKLSEEGTINITAQGGNVVFKGNSATVDGGAIWNDGTINITAQDRDVEFKGNSATNGGAVYNSGVIYSGETKVSGEGTINITAQGGNVEFNGNSATNGGAIYNGGTVGLYAADGKSITFVSDESNKDVDSIYNIGTLNINDENHTGTVNLQKVTNKNETKGVINIAGGTVNAGVTIKQQKLNVKQGATLNTNAGYLDVSDGVSNDGTLNLKGDDDNGTLTTKIAGDGVTNIVAGKVNADANIEQKELNVNEVATLNTNADNLQIANGYVSNDGTVELNGGELVKEITGDGKTVIVGDVTAAAIIAQAITVNTVGTLTANAGNIGGDVLNDGTVNLDGGELAQNITGNGTTVINDNVIANANITQNTLNLANGSVFSVFGNINAENAVVDGATMYHVDKTVDPVNFGNLTLNDDLDLFLYTNIIEEEAITQIKADSVSGDGMINLKLDIPSRIDVVLKNPNIKLDPIALENGEKRSDLAKAIQYDGHSVVTPVFNYQTSYDKETGLVSVATASGGSSEYRDFNPSVFAGAVAAQIGGYLNQLASFAHAFEHMDSAMLTSLDKRRGMKFLKTYDGLKNVWVKPYAVFEKVLLKNGPEVENEMYGSFAGIDSVLVKLKHAWDFVVSGYASYDGSHQKYDEVDVYQNGAHLGATATLYKEDFFAGLTLNAGTSIANAYTMYGTENMNMFMAGAAAKTGYNLELVEDSFIVQPSVLFSYSFINLFDYTNSANLQVHSDPMNAFQIAPELKLIGNLPYNWQPYVSGQYVLNFMDETKLSVDGINLPELSTKQYLQYGVGIQKKWCGRFSAYAQAMFRSLERRGLDLTAGFRLAF